VAVLDVLVGEWRSRTAPAFSPLPFAQRFTGRFSDDGMRIDGRWELARDGEDWAHDFDLVYTRAH
jgi:hypothetical protein